MAATIQYIADGRRIVVCVEVRKCNFKWRTKAMESKIQEPSIKEKFKMRVRVDHKLTS
jgi:hypothetical protein